MPKSTVQRNLVTIFLCISHARCLDVSLYRWLRFGSIVRFLSPSYSTTVFCVGRGRKGRGSHLVNVWKLNKAMLRLGHLLLWLLFMNHLRMNTLDPQICICSLTLNVCVAFGPFALFRSFAGSLVCLLVCVCFFLSSKQSVRIEFRDYGTSKITKGNSLVKHLTMYYIKHTHHFHWSAILFSWFWPYFSGAIARHTFLFIISACCRFFPHFVCVYYWKV